MASQVDNEKRPDEVPSFLPPYEGKRVLKLGDFEDLVKENESIIGDTKSVKYMCADVNTPDLNYSAEPMDLIFSNGLSTRLSNVEIKDIAKNLLKWTKVGGCILFREPCSHQAGEDKQKNNIQDVYGPRFLNEVFMKCHLSDAFGNSFEFSLVGSKFVEAYELNKNNHNQRWWIWKKVNTKDDMGSQPFLDNVHYKISDILHYESIFGVGFVCIGGIDTTKELVAMLDLQPGQKVLDVGCGLGGSAFYMADNFDVDVLGIDLSVNMTSFALERAIGHKRSIEFEVADCTKKIYPHNMFDVIYSRDTILHIQDKPALFRNFFKWLKPGGIVFISDFFGGAKTSSPNVEKIINKQGHDLHDAEHYCQMLKDAGFQEVTKEDRTEQSKDEFLRHLQRLEMEKEEFLRDFSEEEYNYFVSSFKGNIPAIDSGEQKWGIFFAKKEVID